MTTLRHLTPLFVLAVGLAVGVAPAAPVPAAPSDDQLKERATKLNDLTTLESMEDRLKDLLKDKAASKRMVGLALDMHTKAGPKEKPFKFNASLVLGKVAHNLKEYKAAKAFYEHCEASAEKLESEAKLSQAYESLIELSWDQKEFDAVIERAKKLMEASPESKEMKSVQVFAVERMIQATARKGDADEAIVLIGRIYRDGWYSQQLKGYVYREAGRYNEAVDIYEQVIKTLDDADGLTDEQKARFKKNTKYMLTGIFVEDKKVDKAAEILKELMKDDPENPTYPNDLGFVWCDNDKNMKEAEDLVRKALELDTKQRKKLLDEGKIDAEAAKKNTAAYLDSMGWVLFKNKKYKEALTYLLQASEDEEESQHIEIWDHVADCQMALGEVKAAVDTWTKALKFDDISKRDAERRKKVTEKLRKAKAELKKGDDKEEKKKDDKK